MKSMKYLGAAVATFAIAAPAMAQDANGDAAVNANEDSIAYSDASGIGSANNGGTSSYSTSAITAPVTLAATVTEGEAYVFNYGNGENATDDGDNGEASGSFSQGWGSTFSEGAFSNFAGLNALNVNTGFWASQNAAVTVNANTGSISF